jgi:predicted TIM-barrel fold metal-dependent hydrolase
MVFHFGSSPEFMPRSPFDTMIHTMPFNTGVFASELLWSPVLRRFPRVKFSLAEGGIGWIPYWLERADHTYQRHHYWTGQDFGDQLPSQVFKERVLTCFIEDYTGLKLRHDIGVENIAWECDYPHSDCTWPTAPESVWKSLQAAQVPDDEIHKITWENACRFYSFDPLAHRPREQCTVGALRAEAEDVDITPKSFGKREGTGPPKAELPS